jgi:hypothetical protein
MGSASVPSQKLVVYIGELSAALARRADDGISGIFRGGPMPPASSRADEICNELLGRDTSVQPATIRRKTDAAERGVYFKSRVTGYSWRSVVVVGVAIGIVC